MGLKFRSFHELMLNIVIKSQNLSEISSQDRSFKAQSAESGRTTLI